MERRWPKAALFAALVCALCLQAPSGFAQSAADRTTARELAAEGQAAFDRGDYETAADRFARADALVHAPTLLLALARSQVKLNKLVQAFESYNQIIREGVGSQSLKVWKQAYEDAKREVEAIRPRLAWVTITVSGATTASVDMDGAQVPAAALGVRRAVNPGEHLIKAQAEGFKPAEKSFSVTEGESTSVELALEAAPSTQSAEGSTVAKGDAELPNASGLPPPADKSKGSGARTIGYVALGVGAAGLIVGGITGFIAKGKHDELEDACPNGKCPANRQDDLDSYRSMGTISTIGFVVGGVGAVAGLTLILTAPKRTETASRALGTQRSNVPNVSLLIGPGSVGATGSF